MNLKLITAIVTAGLLAVAMPASADEGEPESAPCNDPENDPPACYIVAAINGIEVENACATASGVPGYQSVGFCAYRYRPADDCHDYVYVRTTDSSGSTQRERISNC